MLIRSVLAALFAVAMLADTPNLDALRWNSRVLLLFAPNHDDPQLKQQKELLNRQSAGLQERELKVFEVTGSAEADNKLRDKFNVKANSFAVVLIGKDGSKKLKHSEPTNPNEIFRLIDSMPMRKDEMRRK